MKRNLQKCNIGNCKYESKYFNLKKHKANKHNINVTWYQCNTNGCNKKFKQNSSLKRHEKFIHNMNIVWYHCNANNCEYKCKQNSNLKQHQSNKHNININWFYCNINGCTSKFKQKSSLKKHEKYVHDIGNNKCAFCYELKYSNNEYKDCQGTHLICKVCFKKVTGKISRIEQIWSDYTDKHLGTEYLTSSDQNLKMLGGCQLYRPDKLYIGLDIVEIDECDEHQHTGSNYSCD